MQRRVCLARDAHTLAHLPLRISQAVAASWSAALEANAGGMRTRNSRSSRRRARSALSTAARALEPSDVSS